jgi:hypothetical protein
MRNGIHVVDSPAEIGKKKVKQLWLYPVIIEKHICGAFIKK